MSHPNFLYFSNHMLAWSAVLAVLIIYINIYIFFNVVDHVTRTMLTW